MPQPQPQPTMTSGEPTRGTSVRNENHTSIEDKVPAQGSPSCRLHPAVFRDTRRCETVLYAIETREAIALTEEKDESTLFTIMGGEGLVAGQIVLNKD